MAIAAVLSPAAAEELRPGERATVPGSEIAYLADPGGTVTLSRALAAFDAGEARPLQGEVPDFGAVFSTFWLFVPVENAGAGNGSWFVATRAPFFPAVEVLLRRQDGRFDDLLDNTVDDPFAARPVAYRTIISAPFTLAPGEPALLVVHFRAEGMASFAFTLESPESLSALREQDAAVSGAFYGFSVATILFFAVFSHAVRFRIGWLYSGLFAIATLMHTQLDGFAFQFLWPGWPGWNGIAAMVLLNVLSAVAFYAAAKLRDRERPSPRFRRAAYVLAVVSLAINALIPVLGPGAVVIIGYFLFVAVLVAQAVALVPGLRKPSGGFGLTTMAGVVLVAGTGGTLTVLLFAGISLPPLIGANMHRISYIVLSLATMATLVGIVMNLRRDHDSALEREVVAARRDAELNRELFEAERNFARARDLAARRQRRLAMASHDIKQPLASLHMSLETLVAGADPETRGRLKDALDYLEGLTDSYLAESRPGAEEEPDEPEAASGPAPEDGDADRAAAGAAEPYPLSLITGTVDRVFRQEAVSKGLRFTCTGDATEITVPALPLLRLVSNLTSNAVKYTAQGSVTVTAGAAAGTSANSSDGAAVITVEDTGPGMDAQALARFRQAGQKGETSQGEGLGLAIADEIAAELGLVLTVDSTPGAGTRFRIVVPLTAAP
ncbi:MAG: hypothetical protein KDA49_08995 [Rhodospirillaceae bacterium]|nr:hypothetical protein [Rhodospirillaceae bacterium]